MSFIQQELAHFFERPTKVQVDVTNKCNFDCRYCYNKNNDFLKNPELDDAQLLYLVDKIIEELNPVVISFSGGEALLRKRVLIQAISKLKNKDIDAWLTTNASLLNEDVINELKNSGLNKIFTNIDSDDPAVHDMLRGKQGSFSKSMETIRQLVNLFGFENVITTLVVTKKNYKAVVPMAKLSKQLGVKRCHLLDFIPISKESQNLMLNKEQWLELKEDIASSNIQKDIKLQLCHAFLFMSDENRKMDFPFCMAGRFTMVITASGDIVPCNHLKKKEFYCGNALKDNLLEIWQKSEMLCQFRNYDCSDKGCDTCQKFKTCAGGCKAMAYMLKGSCFDKDPYCEEFNSYAIQRK